MLVTVKVEDWQLLDMLLDRCDAWETSKENKDLFEKMYSHLIDSCCFEGEEFDVMKIVDNDVVNYCSVIDNTEKDFNKLLELCEQYKMKN